MYHIYLSKSVVLHSLERGEADRYIFMFTRELGLIGVFAKSIRELRSKLRPSMQHWSIGTVELVRGKNMWRLTNASYDSTLMPTTLSSHKKSVLVRTGQFLRRLMPNEVPDTSLYDAYCEGCLFLRDTELSREELRRLELALMALILERLGYGTPLLRNVANIAKNVDKQELNSISSYESELLINVNNAIHETQL